MWGPILLVQIGISIGAARIFFVKIALSVGAANFFSETKKNGGRGGGVYRFSLSIIVLVGYTFCFDRPRIWLFFVKPITVSDSMVFHLPGYFSVNFHNFGEGAQISVQFC